jgi:hypothetical protein
MFHVPNKFRIRKDSEFASNDSYGNNGAFFIPCFMHGGFLFVIASDGLGWEHVSVSLLDRCPIWNEMCIIKDLFWDENDAVFQFHPLKKLYVNMHPNCLHLWRPINTTIPIPNPILVGIRK